VKPIVLYEPSPVLSTSVSKSANTLKARAQQSLDNITNGNNSLWSFNGLWNFTIGFMNGSQTGNATGIDSCRDAIVTEWINGSLNLRTLAGSGDWLNTFYELWSLLGASDNIMQKCYYSFEEPGWTYYNWTHSNDTTSSNITTNLLFNFGRVFDDVKQIVLYFVNTPY
jgi:hypothetical protein